MVSHYTGRRSPGGASNTTGALALVGLCALLAAAHHPALPGGGSMPIETCD